MDRKKVLVVEDEASIRKFITINLERNNFEVYQTETGEEALKIIENNRPAVVVLDLMLPGMDGFEVCGRIREDYPEIVIIMLTARSQDIDKIRGLELGADDYMVKPFNPKELVARIRSIFRRLDINKTVDLDIIPFKNLTMDLRSQQFFKNEQEIELTPTEFAILKILISNPGRAISRNELLSSVWGKNYFGDLKALDVYIRRLREKIEDDPSSPCFIETVWGYGYRWQDGDENG
jgi:DNA-binding response OmpR family regulator